MYIMGIDPTQVRTQAEGPAFALGTLGCNAGVDSAQTVPTPKTGSNGGSDQGPKVWVYAQTSGGATGEGYVHIINGATGVGVMVTSTNAAAGAGVGFQLGVPLVAIAANGYGWFQVYGRCNIRTSAAAAVGTQLNTTATPGALDDTLTAATTSQLVGITLTTLTGGAAAGAAFLNWPSVANVQA